MALSKATADSIVSVVATDTACQNVIEPAPQLANINPVTSKVLEYSGLAGSVRNIPWVTANALGLVSDEKMAENICLGIAAVTVKAIHKGMKEGRISGVRSCSSTHRTHWGVHHEATWIRTADDGEYVFDWHATLKLRNPTISKESDWSQARGAVHYTIFKGFA